ncbi:hypothetical protein [Aureimonas sp. AU12]|uniref:hypothetical protein n=1 Tax=Aureimonas sp. AU12 TaxID=1638161 RepID=UPI0007842AFF|nr:hypothetical protein [Aureimonas sp. AU12]
MKPIWTGAMITIGALAAAATPAGTPDPFFTRHVTMEGRSGQAYYSSTSRTFRFIAPVSNEELAAVTH